MSKVKYSPDADALLIELSDGSIDHAEQTGQFVTHFSKEGKVVLLEILDAKEFLLECFSSVLRKDEDGGTDDLGQETL